MNGSFQCTYIVFIQHTSKRGFCLWSHVEICALYAVLYKFIFIVNKPSHNLWSSITWILPHFVFNDGNQVLNAIVNAGINVIPGANIYGLPCEIQWCHPVLIWLLAKFWFIFGVKICKFKKLLGLVTVTDKCNVILLYYWREYWWAQRRNQISWAILSVYWDNKTVCKPALLQS